MWIKDVAAIICIVVLIICIERLSKPWLGLDFRALATLISSSWLVGLIKKLVG